MNINTIFPTTLDLMNHLSDYGNLSDEDIFKRSSNGMGVDITQLFELMIERDICKSAIQNIITELRFLANK